jgi:uncharacterized protein (TIGR02270 family)
MSTMRDTSPVQVRRSLPLLSVVQHHLDEAITLRLTRSTLLTSPRATLDALARFDERIAAQLDGLAVAGEDASPLCDAALEPASEGAAFIAAAHALERKDWSRLDRLIALSGARADVRRGVASACGWVRREQLQGVVASLLVSDDPASRVVGLTACAMHRIDPGLRTGRWLCDGDARVRARALRAAGELGCQELRPVCLSALADEDEECRLWAAWSGVLVGDRASALAALAETSDGAGPHRARAFILSLQALSTDWAHRILQGVARNPQRHRWLIKGGGIAGDPAYIPWLIAQMAPVATARLAGEAFSLITGADLSILHLAGAPPEDFESGPSQDADDPDVDMDPDDGLPWPDRERIECWWDVNQARFQPGTRYFMGTPVTREHGIHVLRTGYQRQRILAAHHLSLLDAGVPLFNTSAPAWRQQRLLAVLR